MRRSKHFWKTAAAGSLALMLALPTLSTGESLGLRSKGGPGATRAQERPLKGQWLSGDFHQHTYYTDGSTSFDFVMEKSNEYGLDWWANSEHGGERNRDGNGMFWDDRTIYPSNPIIGAYELSGGHQEMWRWQSLRDFVFPDVQAARALYPDRRIFSGLEWNVPGHEHCSTAIVAQDAGALSAFEYMFDNSDDDFSREGEPTPYGELSKQNGKATFVQGTTGVVTTGKSYPERHADSVRGCAWMQKQYADRLIDNGWIIFAHIERDGAWTAAAGGGYNVEHFRDFNNAAPDICFGFEGAPGHQVNNDRGFGNQIAPCVDGVCTSDDFGGTYGGVGYYTAKVGGLWDALLGEGRRWFNFASSDYHRHYTAGGDDFYPGEYQKTWVYAVDANRDREYDLNEIADGLRSGNAYFVHGDLIDHLEFEAQDDSRKAVMGEELRSNRGAIANLKLKIKFKSPSANNCAADGTYITSCAAPLVDHIDLIAGEISGKIDPADPDYTDATNPTAKVIASFSRPDFTVDREGYHTLVYHLKNVSKNMYFRLRGTNLACGTPFETGPAATLPAADYCSPLADALVTQNLDIDGAQEAWADLWFYSNPIFVYVK
jgi:hypothetical protein